MLTLCVFCDFTKPCFKTLEQIDSVSRQTCTRCVKKEMLNPRHLHIWFLQLYMKEGREKDEQERDINDVL